MTELAHTLASHSRDIDYVKTQLGAPAAAGSGVSHFLFRKDTITISMGSANLSTRGLGSSFIIGHTHGLGWVGTDAGSIAAGSQPYLGDSRDDSWTLQQSGVSMVWTDVGTEIVINWLGGQGAGSPTHMAIGSDSTTVTVSDTTLGSEYESQRYAFDSVSSGTGFVEFESIIPSTKPTEQPTYIREFGLFDASCSGSMFNRNTFTGFYKQDNVELQLIGRLNISGC